jgi:carbon storage regulator
MLILARKIGESVMIGSGIVVTVTRVEGDVVRLGIQAPVDVPVHRQEIYEEIQRSNRQALTRRGCQLPSFPQTASPASLGIEPAELPRQIQQLNSEKVCTQI